MSIKCTISIFGTFALVALTSCGPVHSTGDCLGYSTECSSPESADATSEFKLSINISADSREIDLCELVPDDGASYDEYGILRQPRNGSLSGTPPTLEYMPDNRITQAGAGS